MFLIGSMIAKKETAARKKIVLYRRSLPSLLHDHGAPTVAK